MSKVWRYYIRQGSVSVCTFCEKQISCKDGSTSGLSRHLKRIHKVDLEKEEDADTTKKRRVMKVAVRASPPSTTLLQRKLSTSSKITSMDSEDRSHTDQVLSTFISQLLSGVVESVRQQGYQVAFLASKFGDGNEILSLHGGLSLNIQRQLEVNFKNLIKEAAQEADCSVTQSPEETVPSNHPVSIPITDTFASASSHDDQLSNTIKVECTSEFDASLTGVTEYSPTTDNDTDTPVVSSSGDRFIECENAGINQSPEETMESNHTDSIPITDTLTDTTKLQCNSEADASLTGYIKYSKYSPTTDIYEQVEYNGGEGLLDCREQGLQIKTEFPNDLQIDLDRSTTWSFPFTSVDPTDEDFSEEKNCQYCEFKTRFRLTLIKHMRTHTAEKPYACTECSFRGTHPSHLRKHIMTHTREKPFASLIGYTDYSPTIDTDTPVVYSSGDRFIECEVAGIIQSPEDTLAGASSHNGLTSNTRTGMEYAVYMDTDEEECSSELDGSLTGDPEYSPTTYDVMTHTGEKLFACPQCHYRTRHQSHMKRHILRHTGKKRFVCPSCPFITEYEASMNVHIQRQHSVDSK